jgi:hypothetical protein
MSLCAQLRVDEIPFALLVVIRYYSLRVHVQMNNTGLAVSRLDQCFVHLGLVRCHRHRIGNTSRMATEKSQHWNKPPRHPVANGLRETVWPTRNYTFPFATGCLRGLFQCCDFSVAILLVFPILWVHACVTEKVYRLCLKCNAAFYVDSYRELKQRVNFAKTTNSDTHLC